MRKLPVCLGLTCLIIAVAVLSGCGGTETKTASPKKSVIDTAKTRKVQVGDIEMAYKTIAEGRVRRGGVRRAIIPSSANQP